MTDYVFESTISKELLEEALNVSKFDCNVIIQGETGVGKEAIFNTIYRNSRRSEMPCIKINCSTIQENLAESEFFGYEEGAFTGARSKGKPGFFELADGGVLFLDEIGTLPLSMQSKLLRVLQENQFYRVGGTQQIDVDVRVICASNVPLTDLMAEGTFREDLYYRLNICTLDVPALRDRLDDIDALAEHFIASCNEKYGIERSLSKEAHAALREYRWPGNIRELENVIHRLTIHTKEDIITEEDVRNILSKESDTKGTPSLSLVGGIGSMNYYAIMEEQEKRILQYAMERGGTTRKAAKLIGLPHTTFARKKAKYNI